MCKQFHAGRFFNILRAPLGQYRAFSKHRGKRLRQGNHNVILHLSWHHRQLKSVFVLPSLTKYVPTEQTQAAS